MISLWLCYRLLDTKRDEGNMTDKYCCFVISPGRCGTQWLGKALRAQLDNKYRIEHEPVNFDYAPTINSPSSPLVINEEKITVHLESILATLKSGLGYIETGFPNWRHIAWLQQKISVEHGYAVKFIRIKREPVANALSLLKLNAFVPPLLPHLPCKTFMRPTANDACLSEMSEFWSVLSPFEKCLYYWAEVQIQANKYQLKVDTDYWLDVSFEQLFLNNSMKRILDFLGEPFLPIKFLDKKSFGGTTFFCCNSKKKTI